MELHVDHEHIQVFLRNGNVERLDETVSDEAEKHLERVFPLRIRSTVVDWDKIPSTELKWNTVSDDEAVRWALTTTAGRCEFGLLLFSGKQPCLIGALEFMVRHLDELVWRAPGSRILFGVDRTENGRIQFTGGLIEYNGKGELFGTAESQTTSTDTDT